MPEKPRLQDDHTDKRDDVRYCGTLTLNASGFDMATGTYQAEYLYQHDQFIGPDEIKSATDMVSDRFFRLAFENGFILNREALQYQLLGNQAGTKAIFQLACNVISTGAGKN